MCALDHYVSGNGWKTVEVMTGNEELGAVLVLGYLSCNYAPFSCCDSFINGI